MRAVTRTAAAGAAVTVTRTGLTGGPVTAVQRPGRLVLAAAALALALVGRQGHAGGAAELVAAGNDAFRDGLYQEAVSHYESARAKASGDPVPLFNMGVAFYREENFAAALGAFQSIQEVPPSLAPALHYNQGNALARLAQAARGEDPEASLGLLRASVAAYARALEFDPAFTEAAINQEVVRGWIEEVAKEAQQKARDGEQSADQQSQPGGQQQPGQSGPGQKPDSQSPAPQGPQAVPAPGEGSRQLRDETAQAILREEQERREADAESRGESSDGRANW